MNSFKLIVPIITLLLSTFTSISSYAQRIYSPNTVRDISASRTYCQGATANNIRFRYYTCNTGSGSNVGVAITIRWYSNTVNSNSGGTLRSTTNTTSGTNSSVSLNYTPSTATVGALYYYCQITWTSAGSCNISGVLTSPTSLITVGLAPAPIGGSSTVCVGSTINLTNATAGGTWRSSSTSVASIGLNTGIATGVAAGTTTISYRASCGSRVTKVLSVSVTPTVAAITGGTSNICIGSSTTLSNTTSGGVWSSNNISVATVNGSGSVTGVTSGTATISYTRTTCATVVATKIVTVSTTPASISGSASTCNGYSLTYSNTIPFGTWSSSNIGVATINSNNGSIATITAGTTRITYNTGCGTAATQVLTVNAGAAAITGTAFVCTGLTTTLSNSVAGGTWSSSNNSIASVNTTGVVSGVAAGTAIISYNNGACSAIRTVTVSTTPSAISGDNNACTGISITYSNLIAFGTWSSNTLGVATINTTSGIISPLTAGTTTITYNTGCGTNATKVLTVNNQPAAITGTTTVCAAATTTLSNSVSGGVWSSSNNAIGTVNPTTGVVRGIAEGNVTISYTNNICFSAINVSVSPLPDAGIISGVNSICEEETSTFVSSGDDGTWSSSNTSVATINAEGDFSANNAGTTTISYSTTNSCGTASTSTIVSVNAATDAGNITGTTTVCPTATTTLANTQAGGVWSSSNTAIAIVGTGGIVTGVAHGNTTISYAVTNGCGTDYATQLVTVNPLPDAGTITGTPVLCQSATTTLANVQPGGVWSSSNSSIVSVSAGGLVTGVAQGNANISYTVTNGFGCVDDVKVVVTVNPIPVVSIISGASALCAGGSSTYTNATVGGVWVSSNTTVATIGTTGELSALVAGTTLVSYTVTNGFGCATTVTTTVTVRPTPTAAPTNNGYICVGGTVTLTANPANGANTYTWIGSSLSATTTENPTATPTATTVYSLTVSDGTGDAGCAPATVYTTSVTVNSTPTAAPTNSGPICVGGTVTLTANGAGGATNFSWSGANLSSTTVANPTATPTVTTVYSLTVTNGTSDAGCSPTTVYTTSVTVRPTPTAAPTNNGYICVGGTVTLAANPANGANTYTWSGSSLSETTTENPTATPTATTVYSLTVSDGTGDAGCAPATVYTTSVTVNPLPVLPAITGTFVLCEGGTTTLYNTTSGGVWTSSNLSVATINSASLVTGNTAGTSTISYTVTTAFGCISRVTSIVTVNPLPATITGAMPICAPNSITLSSATAGGVWSSSHPAIVSVDSLSGVATAFTASYSSLAATVVSYTLPNGCFRLASVVVNPSPAPINGGSQSLCLGESTTMVSLPAIGTWSSSTPAVASVSISGLITSVSAGISIISYTNSYGCSTTRTVTVNSAVAPNSGIFSLCTGQTTTLTNATAGGTWSTTNSLVANINPSTGLMIAVGAGTTTISYRIGVGCFSVSTVTVSSNAASFSGTPSVCVGTTTNLNYPVSGGTWSSTNTGVATVNASGIVTGIATGTTTISYIFGSGCFKTITVTVHSLPAPISGTPLVCVGSNTALTSTGGTWSSSNTAVATINSAGILLGVSSGTSLITYRTTSNGCYVTVVATVNPTPAAITGATPFCAPTSITLSSATAGGVWSSSHPAIVSVDSLSGVATAFPASYSSLAATIVTYTMPNGCFRLASVIVKPSPAPIYGGTQSLCNGTTTTMLHSSTLGTWSSSSPVVATVSTSGLITGISAGTAIISYTNSHGCSTTRPVTINNVVASNSGIFSLCNGQTTVLSNATAGGTWSSANNSVATINTVSGLLTGIGAGTTTISYRIGVGCFSVSTVTVSSNAASFSGTPSVCVGTTTNLSYPVSGGTWSSTNTGVATVNASGIVTGIATGTTTISYIFGSDCFKTITVTVHSLPAPISGTPLVCVGSNTALTSTGGTWSSSNTSVATINSVGTLLGVSSGTSLITYRTTSNGCYITVVATVNALPVIDNPLPICSGATTTLTAIPSGGTWSVLSSTLITIDSISGFVHAFAPVFGTIPSVTTVRYTTFNGCFANRVIAVNPIPSALHGSTGVVCVGGTTTYLTGTTGGTWSTTNTDVATLVSGGTVVGVSPGTTIVSYTNSYGCANTALATVYPVPGANVGTTTICVGQSTILSNSTGTGTWSTTDLAKVSVNATTGLVTGVNIGSATVTYRINPACFSVSNITVAPGIGSISGPNALCIGASATYTSTAAGGTWESSNPTVATISSSGIVSAISFGTTTITYSTSFGCFLVSTVTVNSNAASFLGTPSVCIGTTTNLNYPFSGGIWSSTNTGVATINSSGLVTGIATGTITISYVFDASCFKTITVTVHPIPVPISGTPIVCEGATTTLSHIGGGGTWSTSNSGVATIDSLGTLFGVSSGTAVISYRTTSDGCYVTVVATVNLTPAAINGATPFCAPTSIGLSSATPGGVWSSSHPAIVSVDSLSGVATAFTISYSSLAATIVTYTLPNGCFRLASVVVNPSPAPINGGSQSLCLGESTTMESLPAIGTWSSSSPAVAFVSVSGLITSISAGTTIISYTNSYGCSATRTVTVNSVVAPNSGIFSLCTGQTTTLTNATAGGTWSTSNSLVANINSTTGLLMGIAVGTTTISYRTGVGCFSVSTVTVNSNAASFSGTPSVCIGTTTNLNYPFSGGTWSSTNTGAATINSSGLVTGVATGTTTISYVFDASCFKTITVTVHPVPVPISGAPIVCEGATTTLSHIGGGGTWSTSNSGVAAIDSLGILFGVSSGTAVISYRTTSDGCYVTVIATVNPTPAAITGATPFCAPTSITLSSATPGGVWSSSHPAIVSVDPLSGVATAFTASYSSLAATIVSYTMPNGCFRLASVVVNPSPAPINGGSQSLCIGESTTMESLPAIGTWSSSSPSVASVSVSGLITSISAGTTIISYTNSYGCSATRTVTVNSVVTPNSGIFSLCTGQTTTLTNATAGGTWSTSNSLVANINSTTGLLMGIAVGTTTISYRIGVGCFSVSTVTVSSNAASFSGTPSVCIGTTTNLSYPVSGGTWSSTNTGVATVNASGIVTGIATGTTTVSYIFGAGCFKTITVTVHSLPAPISGTPLVCVGSNTALTSTGGTWSSSNTAVATINSAGILLGVSSGTSVISYRTTSNGCYMTVVATVNPVPAPVTGATAICAPTSITLSSATAGGVWSSSHPSVVSVDSLSGVATAFTSSYSSLFASVVKYTLPNGCFRFASVVVNPTPAPINGGSQSLCLGESTTMVSLPAIGTWSSSAPSVASISVSGLITSVSAGTSIISYTNSYGCSTTRLVTVNSVIAPNSGIFNLCNGQTTVLSNATPGGTWSTSNSLIANINPTTGFMIAVGVGTATISYRIGVGCFSVSTVTVNSNSASFTGTPSLCVGAAVTYTGVTPGGTWVSSNPSVATVNASGMVSAISLGTTIITYTTSLCSSTKVVTVNCASRPIGEDINEVSVFAIYPNPITGNIFNIQSVAVGMLTLSSIDGKMIGSYSVSEGVTQLSIPQDTVSGIYLARFTDELGKVTTFRIVVNR